jgi:hypothetical protein
LTSAVPAGTPISPPSKHSECTNDTSCNAPTAVSYACAHFCRGYRLADSVAAGLASSRQRAAEAEVEAAKQEEEEARLMVLVLLCEDLPMTCVNLWVMLTFLHEVSAVLITSFSVNCVMLGFKLPAVMRYAKFGAKRVAASAAVARLREMTSARSNAVDARRTSVIAAAAAEKETGSSTGAGSSELLRLRAELEASKKLIEEKNTTIADLQSALGAHAPQL